MKKLFEQPKMDIMTVKFEAVTTGDDNDLPATVDSTQEPEW